MPNLIKIRLLKSVLYTQRRVYGENLRSRILIRLQTRLSSERKKILLIQTFKTLHKRLGLFFQQQPRTDISLQVNILNYISIYRQDQTDARRFTFYDHIVTIFQSNTILITFFTEFRLYFVTVY